MLQFQYEIFPILTVLEVILLLNSNQLSKHRYQEKRIKIGPSIACPPCFPFYLSHTILALILAEVSLHAYQFDIMRNPDSYKHCRSMTQSALSGGFSNCENNLGKLPSITRKKGKCTPARSHFQVESMQKFLCVHTRIIPASTIIAV